MITVGIDPSRGNLSVCIVKDMQKIGYFEVSNDISGHEKIFRSIKEHDPYPKVYVEGHGDFAKRCSMFLRSKLVEVFEINPLKARRFKESRTWDKSDHVDAYTAALMPFQNMNVAPIEGNEKIEGLRILSRELTEISKNITASKNRYHSYLFQNYGPVYKKIFQRLNISSLSFFIKFPSISSLKRATLKDIQDGLISGEVRYYRGKCGLEKAKKIKAIVSEYKGYTQDTFTEINSRLISILGKTLLEMFILKNELEKTTENYLKKYFPDYIRVFKKHFEAIGIIGIASILSEIGNIDNFPSDGHLASYAGQAPVNLQSAGKKKAVRRRNYNRHLARTIHILSLNNSKNGFKYSEYYENGKKRFAKKLRALKSVKRQICKEIFVLMKDLAQSEKTKNVSIKPA